MYKVMMTWNPNAAAITRSWARFAPLVSRTKKMRSGSSGVRAVAWRVKNKSIRVAAAGVRRLYRVWAALSAGGTLRLTWPLHESWLQLI